MLRYFLADSLRVLRRPIRWIALACAIAVSCGWGWISVAMGQFGIKGPAAYAASTEMAVAPMLIAAGVIELLFVFGDDFRAKIAQAAIGGGVSRAGVVMGKYLEYALLTLVDTALLALIYYIAGPEFGGVLSGGTLQLALAHFLILWIRFVCYGSLCLIVLFLAQDVKPGLLLYLATTFMVVPFLVNILVTLGPLEGLRLNEYFMFHALEQLQTYFIGGRISGPLVAILCGNVAVCCLIAIAVYRRRELEF